MRIKFGIPTVFLTFIASGFLHAQSYTSSVVTVSGNAAPDGNGTLATFADAVLNDGGQAAFSASLAGTAGGGSDDGGIFAGSGGTLTQIAREGQSVPGGDGVISSFTLLVRWNDSGTAGFFANLSGTSGGGNDNNGIFLGSGGPLTQIVRKGQVPPGGNGVFANPNVPALNNNGVAGFASSLTGTIGGLNDDSGIFTG